jgi:hypothetical protein
MDWEAFFSGYCRQIDGARTVCCECTNGALYADCLYGNCPYESACSIAQSIQNKTNA